MNRHVARALVAMTGACLTAVAIPASAVTAAGGPTIERERIDETFADEFLFDLCGIETMTRVTGHFQITRYPDGTERLHSQLTYRPDHPGVPVERQAATGTTTPDGVRTVVGMPIQLSGEHGTTLLDAGRIVFGEEVLVRGPHPYAAGVDLAQYYCPQP